MVVKKTQSAKTRARKKNAKHVVVHPHHVKPYRKRHIGLLLISLTLVITIAIVVFQYRDQVIAGVNSGRNFISDMFPENKSSETTVESTNGFSIAVDQSKLYVMAVDGYSGTLYEGDALSQKRAYSKIQIATSSVAKFQESQTALTLAYHTEAKKPLTGGDLSALALNSAGINRKNVEFLKTQQATLGGKTFEQSVWVTKQKDGPIKNLRASFSTYTTDLNGYPLTIVISEGVTNEPGTHQQFDSVLHSLRFGPLAADISNQTVSKSSRTSTTLFDTVMMANVASAATTHAATNSEKTAALYGPAVAKIYNVYCMDIVVSGRAFIKEFCNGGTGSGFFVSQDGYFVTNGHVAAVKPKDVAIYYSYLTLALTGSTEYMNYLFELAGGRESDYASLTDPTDIADMITNKLYEIDDAKFEKRNDIQNTFVVLGDKQPDNTVLANDTKNRQKVSLDATWKSAELVASDYRLIDGIKSFRASDVAILKVDGAHFPVTRLGSFNDVTQGANLAILGFPGSASENGLVDSKTTTATLTTGKVSSKKNASGSDNRLIETDTTIGRGNSGGPAFSDEGKVIGIATYTSDGSGQGGGVFNYIRDIKDLQDLAAKSSISFDTESKTQSEWETGMGYFYESRYSKALKNFAVVKELYPNHNKVSEFIATAEKRIANGEDVVDFPWVPVIIAASVGGIGLGVGVFLIVRHRKRHIVYKAGVAQGVVTPGTVQAVTVSAPTVHPVEPMTSVGPVAPQQPVSEVQVATNNQPVATAQPQYSQATPVQPVSQVQDQSHTEPLVQDAVSHEVQQADDSGNSQVDTPEFVQPIMTNTPRTPASFSVPQRTDVAPVSRPSVSSQSSLYRR